MTRIISHRVASRNNGCHEKRGQRITDCHGKEILSDHDCHENHTNPEDIRKSPNYQFRCNPSCKRDGKGNNLFAFLFENHEVANPESTPRTFRIRAKAEVRDIGKCVHVG